MSATTVATQISQTVVRTGSRKVREIENIWIPMSDGTRLPARMWLPEDAADNFGLGFVPEPAGRTTVLQEAPAPTRHYEWAVATRRSCMDGGRTRFAATCTERSWTTSEVSEILDHDSTSANVRTQYIETLKREDCITTPFGGFKQSCFGGRDNSLHAHDQYTQLKTILPDLTTSESTRLTNCFLPSDEVCEMGLADADSAKKFLNSSQAMDVFDGIQNV